MATVFSVDQHIQGIEIIEAEHRYSDSLVLELNHSVWTVTCTEPWAMFPPDRCLSTEGAPPRLLLIDTARIKIPAHQPYLLGVRLPFSPL